MSGAVIRARLLEFAKLFLLSLFFLLLAQKAGALPIGEQIINGNFGSDAGPLLSNWTTSGTVNARASTDAINTSTGNAGFNNFFGSSFAVLGDSTGNIGGVDDSGTHFISQTFSLPVIAGTYDITISFNSVLDGDDRDNINQVDVFTVFLNSTQLLSQNSFSLPDCGPSNAPTCADNQLTQNPFSLNVLGLSGGDYTLKFRLAENNNAQTNTAVGIDNVSVSGAANVQATTTAVPEPSALLLLGSGALAVFFHLKRSKLLS